MDEKEQEIPQIELLTLLTGEFFPDDSGYDYEEELDDEYVDRGMDRLGGSERIDRIRECAEVFVLSYGN